MLKQVNRFLQHLMWMKEFYLQDNYQQVIVLLYKHNLINGLLIKMDFLIVHLTLLMPMLVSVHHLDDDEEEQ